MEVVLFSRVDLVNGIATITQSTLNLDLFFAVKYREHTNKYFLETSLLKLPELIEHKTICFSIMESPTHIKKIWKIREQAREDLRDR